MKLSISDLRQSADLFYKLATMTVEQAARILEVDENADSKTIDKAYKTLSKMWHPDRNKSPEAPTKMSEINQARDVLKNKPEGRDEPTNSDQPDWWDEDMYGDFYDNDTYHDAEAKAAYYDGIREGWSSEQNYLYRFSNICGNVEEVIDYLETGILQGEKKPAKPSEVKSYWTKNILPIARYIIEQASVWKEYNWSEFNRTRTYHSTPPGLARTIVMAFRLDIEDLLVKGGLTSPEEIKRYTDVMRQLTKVLLDYEDPQLRIHLEGEEGLVPENDDAQSMVFKIVEEL